MVKGLEHEAYQRTRPNCACMFSLRGTFGNTDSHMSPISRTYINHTNGDPRQNIATNGGLTANTI